jgi:uncharacterized protein YjbJ (UPF0337 family)
MSSGTGDKVKGRIEKAAGELTNDPNLKDRGRVDETAGKIKDGVERGVDKVRDVLNDDPSTDRNRRP